jgi:hypothetical protein
LRSNGDLVSRKTVELGRLKAQADQRKRDEAALRELEEYLTQLQGDLKVRPRVTVIKLMADSRWSCNVCRGTLEGEE